jgi:hypothetical protein
LTGGKEVFCRPFQELSKGYFNGTTKNLGGEKMKKVLLLTVIALFVMMPFASFAKTAITESDLADLTAQEGVTITFANLAISNVALAVQSWGDSDGFTNYTGSGWVGATIAMTGNVLSLAGTMTIDVGTSGSTTGVSIGLPTLNIGNATFAVDQVVKLSTAKTMTGTQVLGTSYMSGLTATITGGLIITAH